MGSGRQDPAEDLDLLVSICNFSPDFADLVFRMVSAPS